MTVVASPLAGLAMTVCCFAPAGLAMTVVASPCGARNDRVDREQCHCEVPGFGHKPKTGTEAIP